MPPPSAALPLSQRLMQLAQTLQFGWFVGHLTLLFCTFRYSLSYVTFNSSSSWASFSYRLAFVAAAATYGIVVYKGVRTRMKQGGAAMPPPLSLLADENVQYLLMALIWLYSRPIPLAMLPFAVYSVFHVATYTRQNLIPTLQPPPAGAASPGKGAAPKTSSPLADTIGRFVKQYYDASMSLVAALEIALWFRVLLSALTFSKGGILLLIIYTAFFRTRYTQSTFVQGAFHNFAARIDQQVAQPHTPPAVRQAWHTVKGVVEQVAAATDMRRFGPGAPAAAAKKPQ